MSVVESCGFRFARAVGMTVLTCALTAATPTRVLAQGWEFFRSENDHVAEGNELMAGGNPAGALAEYDLAARELPSEAGVHISRGLALLATGESGEAREAFALATDPPASTELRAEANYNMGVAFFGEAEAAATAEDHASAQRLFRDAADSFRDSLRLVPGNRDAGWNLELALRRINEEEAAERAEEEASEDGEEESEDGEEGEDGEESSEGGDEGEEGEEGEEGAEDGSEEENSGEPGDDGEPSGGEEEGEEPASEGGDEGADDAEDGSDGSDETESEDEAGDPSTSSGGDEAGADGEAEGDGSDIEAGGTTDRSLPRDMERVLDALEDGEENLSAARARGRADRERRRVEHDW